MLGVLVRRLRCCALSRVSPPRSPPAPCLVPVNQDGLSSAALFAEMRVALHDRQQDTGYEPESSTPSSALSTSSLSSLACSAPSSTDDAAPTSKWTSGVSAAVKAAATAPSSIFLTRGRGKGGSSGGTSKEDKSAEASPDSPPSSPSTVGASPPSSPSSGVGVHLRDSTTAFSSSASASAAPAAAAADVEAAAGVAREQERRGCSSVLLRRLKALHERYGEFAEENGYVRCEDTEVCDFVYIGMCAKSKK